MRKFHGWLLLVAVTCSKFCERRFYAQGFDIEGDSESCFCADRVKKSPPEPLEITLQWKRSVPEDDRKAVITELPGPVSPRWDVDDE